MLIHYKINFLEPRLFLYPATNDVGLSYPRLQFVIWNAVSVAVSTFDEVDVVRALG